MKPEGKSKIQSLISDLSGLKSRNPEESRLKDWKDKTEKRLEGSFRGSWIVSLRCRASRDLHEYPTNEINS